MLFIPERPMQKFTCFILKKNTCFEYSVCDSHEDRTELIFNHSNVEIPNRFLDIYFTLEHNNFCSYSLFLTHSLGEMIRVNTCLAINTTSSVYASFLGLFHHSNF
jgi:hypothetical protein